jgi:hypothetical protein
LNTLIAQEGSSPMGSKAKTMLDVLSRRKQIEDELTRLQIERPVEDTAKVVLQQPVQQPVIEQEPARALAKRDSVLSKQKADVVIAPVPKKPVDTLGKKQIVTVQKSNTAYRFDPSLNHYAVIILNKVDPVFSGETKNAFNRFNQEKYYNQTLAVNSIDLDSVHKLVLIGTFTNAQDALDYAQRAKRLAPTEIIPWLKPEKYSFSVISFANLEVLQNLKDLDQYKKFLEQNLPGKF